MSMRALLVEDEPDDGLLLRVLLRRGGLQVVGARDVQAARGLAAQPPDVLVVGAGAAESGVRACKALRQVPALAPVPLVVVAGSARDEPALRAAGADAHLTRPLVPRRLSDGLRAALAARGPAARLAHAEAERDWVRYLVHDLNGPLTVLSGSLHLLAGSRLDQRQAVAVEHAREAQRRLTRMVRALLDVQRVGAGGRLATHREPVDAGELLHEAAAAIALPASIRPCTVQVIAAPGSTFRVDRDLVLRALVNLADNALRFVPREGWLQLRVRGNRLEVEDDGPGVPEAERAALFEPYRQRDDGRGAGAAGLGLAFVRLVAEAHGGRAGVETGSAGGACFFLELPVS